MTADPVMEQAMGVFAKGFADTRCYTHPCLAERVGKLWQVKDGPRKNDRGYRREEWIGCGASAKQYRDAAQKHSKTKYVVSAILPAGESDEALREDFKSHDFRLNGTEAFMVHALTRIPRPETSATIERVLDADLADRLNGAFGARQMLPEHLDKDSHVRQYVALEGDAIVGMVRSHTVENATWCANLYVREEHRRKGIGRALMCEMLRDDRKYGSELAVLTASHAGANLYPLVGYREIGMLYIYTPKKVKG